jgi:hypothetical protein
MGDFFLVIYDFRHDGVDICYYLDQGCIFASENLCFRLG